MAKKSNDTLVSVLCYFIVGLVWFLIDKSVQTSLTKHHTKQALNLIFVAVVLHISVAILAIITFGIGGLLAPIVKLFLLIMWVIGLVYAFTDSKKDIPLIGQFANRYLKY